MEKEVVQVVELLDVERDHELRLPEGGIAEEGSFVGF